MKKKANIGLGILIMAVILLLGGILLSDNEFTWSSTKDRVDLDELGYGDENTLFLLNDTSIGRQKKVTESFPNIEVGSKTTYENIYIGNSFTLNANPFTKNVQTIMIQNENYENTKYYYLYFNPKIVSGDNEMVIGVNGKKVAQIKGEDKEMPIILPKVNNHTFYVSFNVIKPPFYSIFNWNKREISDVSVVAVNENLKNKEKLINFDMDLEELEKAYIDVIVSCKDTSRDLLPALKVKVNDYILTDQNPDCSTRDNRLTLQIPLNILKENKNNLSFSTDGFYKLSYGINKIYYTDKQTYKFNVNNFNNIVDVIIYGEFDDDVIDLRINKKLISLQRDEIKSIIGYLRYGVNELKILNLPVDIEELRIEYTEHWDYN
jgi:hypothetical protein